jgi:hypothetical protein
VLQYRYLAPWLPPAAPQINAASRRRENPLQDTMQTITNWSNWLALTAAETTQRAYRWEIDRLAAYYPDRDLCSLKLEVIGSIPMDGSPLLFSC